MTGRTLNHYKIETRLGKGGMGEVYAAEDLNLSRQVALKVLPDRLASNPDRRMRFEREAKAVAALNHPNIVTIYSVEEADGVHFLTMEMVRGKTLSELIPKGGLPLERLLAFAVCLADAVGAAHRKGIIHRDLKPDNVVVGDDGRLKVLDFGLAKLRPESGDPASVTQLPTEAETQEGKILGTVSYMSPEQAEGKPVDARSDIFSLGVLLYQMATGLRPFRGDTPISTISSILRDRPESILDLNRSLPRHLGRIVNRCLAKDPGRRYQTAIDLRNDLEVLEEEVQSGEAMAEATMHRPQTRGRGWLVAAIVLLAAIAVGYGISRLADRGEPDAPSAFEEMKMTRLTSTGSSEEAAISPDGKYVVHVEEGEEGESLWLRQVSLASGVQIVLPTTANLYDPIFSPDGESVYYIKNESGSNMPVLFRVPVLGGPSVKVLEDVAERISFSPDGSRFVFLRWESGSSTIMTASRDGGDVRKIAERAQPEEFVGEPVWSPDGAIVATPATRWTGRMEHRLVAIAADGGQERLLSPRSWGDIGEIAWLPDGSGLVIEAGKRMGGQSQIWEVSYPEGEARRITNDLNSYHGVGLTSDGRTLVTVLVERHSDIWIAPGDDPDETVRIGSAAAGFQMSWFTDGRLLHTNDVGGNQDIWITGEDGETSQITFDAGADYDPVVCGGRYIVFVSDRTGSHNLWRMNLDGGNKIRLTSGEGEYLPQCHPERDSVVFQQQGQSLLSISQVSLDGGEVIVLGEEDEYSWWTMDLSWDGNRVAYLSWEEATRKWVLEILDRVTREVTRIPDMAFQYLSYLRWSPDDGSILYTEDRGDVSNLWSLPLHGGPPQRLTDFDELDIISFAWSPDAGRLALIRQETTRDIVLLENFR